MNIAIVTGASSGMGREFVLQLGAYVNVDEIWVIARRQTALESLKEECRLPIRPITLDLLNSESFSQYEALLAQEKPNVKLLVNAAGFGQFGDFRKISAEDDCRMLDLNCKALVMMTRLTLPYMGRGSHILQLDSLSAFQPVPYITTYGATKSFVLSYSRGISRELIEYGLHKAAEMGFTAALVEGNPANYRARGFQTSADHGIVAGPNIHLPRVDCLMVTELVPGGLEGIHGIVDYGMYETLQ